MTRRLTVLAAGAAMILGSTAARALDDFTIQLKWVTQAQFAGYFVALEKGFYEEEGLDVTIKPGGPMSSWSGCRRRWRRGSAACRWSMWRNSSTAPA